MTKITSKQLQTLHILLGQQGLLESKKQIISDLTRGRTDSSKELLLVEARVLIDALKKNDRMQDSLDKMVRRILAMAHEMGWQVLDQGKMKVDMERINTWCEKFGFGKKPLKKYTYKELPKLVSQFQVGPYKAFLDNL